MPVFHKPAFKNPVTVREEPQQFVSPGGTWEAQVVADFDDFRLIRDILQKHNGGCGGVLHFRTQGDLVETFAIHDTRTAAEATIDQWLQALGEFVSEGRK